MALGDWDNRYLWNHYRFPINPPLTPDQVEERMADPPSFLPSQGFGGKSFLPSRGFGGKTGLMTEILNDSYRRSTLHTEMLINQRLFGDGCVSFVCSSEDFKRPIVRVSSLVPKGEVWMWDPKACTFEVVLRLKEEFDVDDYNEALEDGAFDD